MRISLKPKLQRRGANAIEFALTAPVLFFLILTTMDMGWFFAHSIALDHATTVVANRAAIVITATDMTGLESSTVRYDIGDDEWDNFGLPGDPTFTTTSVTESGVTLIQTTGSVPYNAFGPWNQLLGGSNAWLPSTISVTITRRAENELSTPVVDVAN